MKKIILLILFLIIGFFTWYFLVGKSSEKLPIIKQAGQVWERSQQQPAKSIVEVDTNAITIKSSAQLVKKVGFGMIITNALTLTNLEQWKVAINNLKPLAGFESQQHWLVEQPGRTNGIPIALSLNDKSVQYNAVLISILAKNITGDILEAEMQTQNMDVNETQTLALQLCDMLGIDSRSFLIWAKKTGNHWVDAPLFGIGNKIYSFQIIRTYNDKKPWAINFMITPNP